MIASRSLSIDPSFSTRDPLPHLDSTLRSEPTAPPSPRSDLSAVRAEGARTLLEALGVASVRHGHRRRATQRFGPERGRHERGTSVPLCSVLGRYSARGGPENDVPVRQLFVPRVVMLVGDA